MPTYKTPGVYVEEISIFPPSVAEVETAIPAFVGYTEKADRNGESLTKVPTLIKSMLEYRELFGGAPRPKTDTLKVTLDEDLKPKKVEYTLDHILYYALQLFYLNGGGKCYIVSVGDYSSTPTLATMRDDGLAEVAKYDEPTILLFPDATRITTADNLASLQQAALKQARELMDRIAVLDLKEPADPTESDWETGRDDFRDKIGLNNLKYGAAYTPYLRTTQPLVYRFSDLQLVDHEGNDKDLSELSDAADPKIDKTTAEAAEALDGTESQEDHDAAVELLKSTNSIYRDVAEEIGKKTVVVPPSAAIAGVMATVDRQRGVWKAPANVSLNAVKATTVRIDDSMQADLNVDANAGKSINAIRAFAGKGVIVWGARTLAGNDNEWRYVPVRRFFNMVEESAKKSTGWAVFEPNDAKLWVKVKSMLENYLVQKWREGALAGAVPDDAFFVKVGLGETMSAQDILEGRLIVEIGMAVVRPAEFIILKFSHKMQES